MSEISWRIEGRRPLLTILIFPPNASDLRMAEATALVDTGVTTSAITSELAEKLNLPVIGKRLIASAHGDDYVDRYISCRISA